MKISEGRRSGATGFPQNLPLGLVIDPPMWKLLVGMLQYF